MTRNANKLLLLGEGLERVVMLWQKPICTTAPLYRVQSAIKDGRVGVFSCQVVTVSADNALQESKHARVQRQTNGRSVGGEE